MIEAQHEPGSKNKVLKNLLNIKTLQEMDETEALALQDAQDKLIKEYDKNHCFTAKDICYMHKIWLGKIYPWAGEFRRVNLIKDNFSFAAAMHISTLMEEFEKNVLSKETPCLFDQEKVIKALSQVHVELVLIHPFREGNGRISRLLAILMALQAGLPILDFSDIHDKKREDYFIAVQEGMKGDYKPMEGVFRDVVKTSVLRVNK
jgi:cell filamentation protein